MRVIHEVSAGEQLVCEGAYTYLSGGEPIGYTESWQITRLSNGYEVIRADIDGGNAEQETHLLIHLLRDEEGQPKWLRLRYGKPRLNCAAQYTFKKASVHIARRIPDGGVRQEVIEIASGYAVDCHSTIAHDYVWRGYPASARGRRRAIPIFSPDLWLEDHANLTGRALRFNVQPLGVGQCETELGVYERSRRFEIVLSDGVKAEAWYDREGIPLRWRYPEKDYEFVLSAFERH